MEEDYGFYEHENDLRKKIIAMDNILVDKATRFSAEEQRLFYVTLASVKPEQQDNVIEIDKEAMMDLLGFKSQNMYSRIRMMFIRLMEKSMIHFEIDEFFSDGFLFSKVKSTKKKIYVTVDKDYVPLLIQLQSGFTRLLNDDVISFNSKFSMLLYQQCMRWNTRGVYVTTTKQLKDLFGLSKDDYVNSKTGRFDRYNFEEYTIHRAVVEINEKSKCISELKCEKKKQGNRVQGYVFTWKYMDPNNIENMNKQDEKTV